MGVVRVALYRTSYVEDVAGVRKKPPAESPCHEDPIGGLKAARHPAVVLQLHRTAVRTPTGLWMPAR